MGKHRHASNAPHIRILPTELQATRPGSQCGERRVLVAGALEQSRHDLQCPFS